MCSESSSNCGANCVRVDFHSGTMILPLGEESIHRISKGTRITGGRLVMSIVNTEILDVLFQFDISGQTILENYQQKLHDMGHIMSNS